MNPRKTAFFLTLLAGITGTIVGLTALLSAWFLTAISDNSAAELNGLDAATGGMVVVLAAITLVIGLILIIFAVLMKRNAKLFGILTLAAGVVGFFLMGLLFGLFQECLRLLLVLCV
ncbi:DUF4064 domain-containing protein [Listeria innocua]|uniref:DUF4064 domain-containing protein n=1 Tax=Listeria innocua TaxID=1642 RepID=UPI0035E3D2CB